MNERTNSIYVRVSDKEKNIITKIAGRCDLTLSEYLRKRALGFVPSLVIPDFFFLFYSELCKLCNAVDGKFNDQTEEKILKLIDDIGLAFFSPNKETVAQIKAELERE
jgi:hypothetical protein